MIVGHAGMAIAYILIGPSPLLSDQLDRYEFIQLPFS